MLGEPNVPAEPLLYQSGAKAAGEAETEAEEPKNVHMNRISWGSKRVVKGRGCESISVGDPSEFLRDLLKKPGGHVGGIGPECLVAVDEKCSNRRRENTCLENVAKR